MVELAGLECSYRKFQHGGGLGRVVALGVGGETNPEQRERKQVGVVELAGNLRCFARSFCGWRQIMFTYTARPMGIGLRRIFL